ncbi:MAG: transposase [Oligoflexia bacterium]|nr:transposase [Oligoflexia bacterium]
MSYHPRIETTNVATFQTTRTRCSELWFVNSNGLEQAVLGYLAKYVRRYGVKLYAFAIEGNHIQFPALFPKGNRAHFMRDLNSSIARTVPRYQKSHPQGKFWARRYSAEYLPHAEDIEEQFFYTVLQPVQDGLVDSIYDYPAYNCFEDAITGRIRKFEVVRWKEYHDALRWDAKAKVSDFTETIELSFARLPGYEDYSATEYENCMRKKLCRRTADIIIKRKQRPCVGNAKLRLIVPGSRPIQSKTSTIKSHRPRVLSKDNQRRAQAKAWYFSIYFEYRISSERYRAGDLTIQFPPGTYKPPAFTCTCDREILYRV